MSYSTDSALFAAARSQAMVEGGKIAALYPNGCPGNFDKHRTQPGIPVAGFAAHAFPSALVIVGTYLSPGSQMVGIRETRDHVRADLGENFFSTTAALTQRA